LVYGTREGRTITYRADAAGTKALIGFLVKDCCEGKPELCGFSGSFSEEPSCGSRAARSIKKEDKQKNVR
jgi:hypothetical protein